MEEIYQLKRGDRLEIINGRAFLLPGIRVGSDSGAGTTLEGSDSESSEGGTKQTESSETDSKGDSKISEKDAALKRPGIPGSSDKESDITNTDSDEEDSSDE